jgi:hypothetical protein
MDSIVDQELGVGALDLEQHMAMWVGMTNKRIIHVEEGDPSERSMRDAQCLRHLLLRQGCGDLPPGGLKIHSPAMIACLSVSPT